LIQLGAVPDMQFKLMVDMTPVDYVSQAVVALSRNADNSGRVFHLVNPGPMDWDDLMAWIVQIGYPLRVLPLPEWYDQWQQFARGTSEYGVLGEIFSFAFQQLSQSQPVQFEPPRYDCSNTLAGLRDTSIACPPLGGELLEKYFQYFVSSGFLAAPRKPSTVNCSHR